MSIKQQQCCSSKTTKNVDRVVKAAIMNSFIATRDQITRNNMTDSDESKGKYQSYYPQNELQNDHGSASQL